jgi:hypothetical protein
MSDPFAVKGRLDIAFLENGPQGGPGTDVDN